MSIQRRGRTSHAAMTSRPKTSQNTVRGRSIILVILIAHRTLTVQIKEAPSAAIGSTSFMRIIVAGDRNRYAAHLAEQALDRLLLRHAPAVVIAHSAPPGLTDPSRRPAASSTSSSTPSSPVGKSSTVPGRCSAPAGGTGAVTLIPGRRQLTRFDAGEIHEPPTGLKTSRPSRSRWLWRPLRRPGARRTCSRAVKRLPFASAKTG